MVETTFGDIWTKSAGQKKYMEEREAMNKKHSQAKFDMDQAHSLEYNSMKEDHKKAKEAMEKENSELEKTAKDAVTKANDALKAAKKAIPQDTNAIQQAKENLAQAKTAQAKAKQQTKENVNAFKKKVKDDKFKLTQKHGEATQQYEKDKLKDEFDMDQKSANFDNAVYERVFGDEQASAKDLNNNPVNFNKPTNDDGTINTSPNYEGTQGQGTQGQGTQGQGTQGQGTQGTQGQGTQGQGTQGTQGQGTQGQGTQGQGTQGQGTQGQGTQGTQGQGTQGQGTQGQGTQGQNQGFWNGVKQGIKDHTNNGFHLSDSFYRDMGAMIKRRPTGNLFDVASATSREQAQNLRNEAATHQMEAQRSQQIANQNPFYEAGKVASFQNDAENRQRINNQSFSAGTASARLRKTNTPNIQEQYAREDAQQGVANERRDEEQAATQDATEHDGMSQEFRVRSRDLDSDVNISGRLSRGEPGTNEDTPNPAEETPKPDADPPAEPEQPEMTNSDWQNVFNYVTFGNDPSSDWSKPEGGPKHPKEVVQKARAYAQSKGWKPLTADEVASTPGGFNAGVGPLQQVMARSRPEFYKEWKGSSERFKDGKQINAGDNGVTSEDFQKVKTGDIPLVDENTGDGSDIRIKNLKTALSDLRMKHIREDWDRDGVCSREDHDWLLKRAGNYKHGDREYNAFNDADFDDGTDESVLQGYADFIKNYVYTYKPEATKIDSSIDPDQEHIGPMAQDIEQVNPACIKETKDGIKTVDTSRLSLMNAGAIGELARQLNELNEKFKSLGF